MRDRLLYALTVLIWGSGWLAIEFQLGVVPIEVSIVYRMLIAAALTFAWCLMRGDSLRFGWRDHRYFILLGLCLFGLNFVSAYSAQMYITSALNAIVFSSMVWLNIINARLFFGTRIEPNTYAGAGLGLFGIVVLFWPEVRDVSLSDRVLVGAGLSLLGALLASLGNTVAQAGQRRNLPVLASNAWGMFYGALVIGVLALAQGRAFVFDFSPGYVIALLFMAVFGSVVAFALYVNLLRRIGLERAGYIVVLIPIVALTLSALFEDLQLEWHLVAGVALVLAGNVVILRR